MFLLAACQPLPTDTVERVVPDLPLRTVLGDEVRLHDYAVPDLPVAMMVIAGPTDADAEYASMLTIEADELGLRPFVDSVEAGDVLLLWVYSDRTPRSSEQLAIERYAQLPSNTWVLRDDGALATHLDVAYPRPARGFWLEPDLTAWGGDFWWQAATTGERSR